MPGWPGTVASKLIIAYSTPETWLQSTEANTRVSGLDGETEPLLGLKLSQETFELAVNVKGFGPPAPTSMKREPNGTKGSIVSVGGGQL